MLRSHSKTPHGGYKKLGGNNEENLPLIVMSIFFEDEFSIDWIQDILNQKTSRSLQSWRREFRKAGSKASDPGGIDLLILRNCDQGKMSSRIINGKKFMEELPRYYAKNFQ